MDFNDSDLKNVNRGLKSRTQSPPVVVRDSFRPVGTIMDHRQLKALARRANRANGEKRGQLTDELAKELPKLALKGLFLLRCLRW